MLRQLIAGFVFLLMLSGQAQSTVFRDCSLDSAPSSEVHNGAYTCATGTLLLRLENGTAPTDMFDHVTGSECWGGSGGCAKFWPATAGAGGYYRSLVPGVSLPTQLNLRYLRKWNSAWGVDTFAEGRPSAGGWKGEIFYIGGERNWTNDRAPNAALGGPQFATEPLDTSATYYHGNNLQSCPQGYCCNLNPSTCELGPGVAAAGPFYLADWVDQWVCYEFQQKSSGEFTVYIWTQDGTYNGMFYRIFNGPPGGTHSGTPLQIEGFGGLHFIDHPAVVGSYMMVDEVVISDTYIGPPAGFVGGTPQPLNTGITPWPMRVIQ